MPRTEMEGGGGAQWYISWLGHLAKQDPQYHKREEEIKKKKWR
jgi:hypothetical protein